MPATAATGGLSLTTALQDVVKNPANSRENRTYEIRFLNIDGTNSADVSQCVLVDASAVAANPSAPKLPVMPVKTTIVPGGDGAKFTRVVLEPGDAIQAASDFGGRIYALVQQVFAEPAA